MSSGDAKTLPIVTLLILMLGLCGNMPVSAATRESDIITRTSGNWVDEKWLRMQPDTHYTIQILATADIDKLRDYAHTHQLHAPLFILTVPNSNPLLYALLQGSFSTREQLQKSIHLLPQEIKPWIRIIGNVKKRLAPLPKPDPLPGVGQSLPPPPSPIANTASPAPTAALTPRQKDDMMWVTEINPDHYTIMLTQSPNKSELLEIVSQQVFSEPVSITLLSKRPRPVYALVYGVYPNAKAAQSAIPYLPKALNYRNSAQIRAFFTIQHLTYQE